MYAIQEPIVGFIAGVMSSFAKLRINRNKSSILIDVLIQQILFISFGATCYTFLIIWLNPSDNTQVQSNFYNIYK
jgi:hypothetical protein